MNPQFRPRYKDKEFLQWIRDTYEKTPHHLYGRHNDLSGIPIDNTEHRWYHDYGRASAEEKYDKDYDWELINTLMDYIKYLKEGP